MRKGPCLQKKAQAPSFYEPVTEAGLSLAAAAAEFRREAPCPLAPEAARLSGVIHRPEKHSI